MRRRTGKWLFAKLEVQDSEQAGSERAMAALLAVVIATIALGTTSEAQADPRRATATTVDNTRVSGPVGGIVLENDFARLIFVKPDAPVTNLGKTKNVYQGKLVNAREFVSATILYQPPLPAIADARFVGGDAFSDQDLVAMRCRPSNPSELRAMVASWPNVFAEATSDLADLMGYTPSDCPQDNPDLDPRYPVDQRVYCASETFSDQKNLLVPIALQNAVDTGATVFQFTGTPFLPTGSTTGADVLFDLYGIGKGFSGLGYSVKDSFIQGSNVALTASQSLEQSVVTEYLALNVPLAAANCRCVRVRPYAGRDTSPLNWNHVWSKGRLASDGSCVTRARLP
jgi:hypothetical protein